MSAVGTTTPSLVQVTGALLSARPVGAYQHLTIAAPGIAAYAAPGQFAALAVGGPTSANLLRRCFSIHRVGTSPSDQAGPASPAEGAQDTVEIVVSAVGAGTVWLTGLRPGDPVDVVGPLGRGFPLPDAPTGCVLVGGGYGSAPLFWLAEELRTRGCRVEMVLGAATQDRLFGVEQASEVADRVSVTTDDGSAGVRGWVSDVLPEAISRTEASVVYACGPMGMLEAVTTVATTAGVQAQVAVEESMACGVGVCMTCVLPVRSPEGVTAMVRSCVEGPVFRGDQVRWDAFDGGVCRVPADAVGAPQAGGH